MTLLKSLLSHEIIRTSAWKKIKLKTTIFFFSRNKKRCQKKIKSLPSPDKDAKKGNELRKMLEQDYIDHNEPPPYKVSLEIFDIYLIKINLSLIS